MSWDPPERPDWARALNAGEPGPLAEEAAHPLTRDALLNEAAARQGRDGATAAGRLAAFGRRGFEAEPVFEALDRLTRALEDEAALTVVGRLLARRFLLRVLEVRLQILGWLDDDPGVQEERIDTPWFVAGAPRTGTTILHTLLAADSRHRVPRGWELLRPVPPPEGDDDARIALADRELVAAQRVVSRLQTIHAYGGTLPKECLSAMSFAIQSEEFTARFAVPSYERWLTSSDMTPAYRMHRLVLQILQRRQPTSAWVLKSPVHIHDLPTLFATYPDARVAISHRDPLPMLASLTSLIATLRFAHSDRVDPDTIARAHVARYETSFARLVDWREQRALPEEQLHHSHFADFRRDAMAVMQELYARFGRSWTDEVQAAMRGALDANPADRHGTHTYDRNALGEPPDAARARFAAYQRVFEVPTEA